MPYRNRLFIIIIIDYYYQCFQRFMNDWFSVRRLILYNNVLNSNISAYRKGQSITTVLQVIRDDIVTAMKRSEVTMMILADFSKAFDTICFRNLIIKMSKIGFSRDFLIWTLNYVMHRKQFVQIDDTCSEVKNVNFGVPQGSFFGPVLFTIYVADLQENVNVKCFQYAGDITI